MTNLPIGRAHNLFLDATVYTVFPEKTSEEDRFGVSLIEVKKFRDNLCKLEIEGIRARSHYTVEWKSANPAAENYIWTILANKVRIYQLWL